VRSLVHRDYSGESGGFSSPLVVAGADGYGGCANARRCDGGCSRSLLQWRRWRGMVVAAQLLLDA